MKKFSLILFAIFIGFASCGTHKKTMKTKTIIKNDTIISYVDRIILKREIDSIIIKNPCDSLGILKPFQHRIKTTHGVIVVKSENNKIKTNIDLDSVISTNRRTLRTKTTNTTTDTKQTKTRWAPFWLIIVCVVSILLNLLLIKARF